VADLGVLLLPEWPTPAMLAMAATGAVAPDRPILGPDRRITTMMVA